MVGPLRHLSAGPEETYLEMWEGFAGAWAEVHDGQQIMLRQALNVVSAPQVPAARHSS